MSKKIYIIEQDNIEYVAKTKDNKISLNYSNGDQWTDLVRGKNIGKIKDTGNEIKINFKDDYVEVDYSDFIELFVLLKLKIDQDGGYDCEFLVQDS